MTTGSVTDRTQRQRHSPDHAGTILMKIRRALATGTYRLTVGATETPDAPPSPGQVSFDDLISLGGPAPASGRRGASPLV